MPGASHRNRIFARGPETLLPLQARSVHCVVTAPPFPRRGSQDNALSQYINRLAIVARELHRVLRDDGTLWLILGHAAVQAARRNPHLPGLTLRESNHTDALMRRIAGRLRTHGWVRSQSRRVRRAFSADAGMLVLAKSPAHFIDRDALSDVSPIVDHRAVLRRSILAGSSALCCSSCGSPYKRARQRRRGAGYALSLRPVCPCAAPSARSIVLDPFLGAGTTALVALGCGRDTIGFLSDEASLAKTISRLGLFAESFSS